MTFLADLAVILRAISTAAMAAHDELTDALDLTPYSPPAPPMPTPSPPLAAPPAAADDTPWTRPDAGIITVTTTHSGNVTRVDLHGQSLPYETVIDDRQQPGTDGHVISYAEIRHTNGIIQTIGTPYAKDHP